MFKRIAKHFFRVFLILVVIFFVYEYVEYYEFERFRLEQQLTAETEAKLELQQQLEAETNARLQEELLVSEIQRAANFVNSINNEVALTLLRNSGSYQISHDQTPNNNKSTEWLFNSDIIIYVDYIAIFSIEAINITTSINEDGSINIYYDVNDISLSSLDLTNLATSYNTGVFGRSYTPDQVTALEQIARDKIIVELNTSENITQAKLNLEDYFYSLADSFNVTVFVMEKSE